MKGGKNGVENSTGLKKCPRFHEYTPGNNPRRPLNQKQKENVFVILFFFLRRVT